MNNSLFPDPENCSSPNLNEYQLPEMNNSDSEVDGSIEYILELMHLNTLIANSLRKLLKLRYKSDLEELHEKVHPDKVNS